MKFFFFTFTIALFPLYAFCELLQPEDKNMYITSTNEGTKKICNHYKLNHTEYSRIFPVNNKTIPVFNVITPIKSGTNLLLKTLSLMTSLPSSGLLGNKFLPSNDLKYYYFQTHFGYTNSIENILISGDKTLTIIRDLRDILISQCNWYKQVQNEEWINSTIYERCKILLKNPSYFGNSSNTIAQLDMLKNLIRKNNEVFIARYESLVGSRGGESDAAQAMELKNISSFLGIALEEPQFDYIARNLFGNSYSFRKGTTEQWKEYFDDDLKTLFKEVYGAWLIELGYEKDNDW